MTNPKDTASRLRQGVNLSHWYGQVHMEPGYQPSHYATYMTQGDLQLIAAMGFDHVRFPIAQEHAMTPDGGLDSDFVERIAFEVGRLHQLNLAVIVDMHPEFDFKHELATSDEATGAFVRFWTRLAERFSDHDPQATVFEVLNEPSLGNGDRWSGILRQCVASIRTVAPEHTVIASGDQYSEIPRLLELPEIDDGNVIYNFHLYDPLAFSHQGAGWLSAWVEDTRGLDYPADPTNVAALREMARHREGVAELDSYIREGWDRSRYEEFIRPAIVWAEQRGAPLICNEFGIYREFAPRDGRLRWLRDVSSIFEENSIGWTVWDYAGDFGAAIGDPGSRCADAGVADALGLVGRA